MIYIILMILGWATSAHYLMTKMNLGGNPQDVFPVVLCLTVMMLFSFLWGYAACITDNETTDDINNDD